VLPHQQNTDEEESSPTWIPPTADLAARRPPFRPTPLPWEGHDPLAQTVSRLRTRPIKSIKLNLCRRYIGGHKRVV
jgi:hypothetical protein